MAAAVSCPCPARGCWLPWPICRRFGLSIPCPLQSKNGSRRLPFSARIGTDLMVAVATGKGGVSILDLEKGQIARQINGIPSQHARVSPDGKFYFAQGGIEQLCSYRIEGTNLVEFQKTERIAQNGQGIAVSADSKYVCLPSAAGNYGTKYGIHVYAVDNLKKAAFTVEPGAYPKVLAIDTAAQLIYTHNAGNQLIVYNMKAMKSQGTQADRGCRPGLGTQAVCAASGWEETAGCPWQGSGICGVAWGGAEGLVASCDAVGEKWIFCQQPLC